MKHVSTPRKLASTGWLVSLVAAGLIAASTVSAQTFSLVKDINTGSGATEDGFHYSGTTGLVECGPYLYFVGESKGTGEELWRTDGTEAGTELILEVYRGENQGLRPQYFACADTKLYFARSELYVTNGSATGTSMVRDINPGSEGSYPKSLFAVDGLVYFLATDGTHGDEPWVSDGTETGTFMLKDILPGSSGSLNPLPEFFEFGGWVYFGANSGGCCSELWRTDGTEAGTERFATINSSQADSSVHEFTRLGDSFYFSADDGTHGHELWSCDGTEAGTTMVIDLNSTGSSNPTDLTVMDGTLYFVAVDDTFSQSLWRSDGTAGGTSLVKDVNPGGPASLLELTAYGNALYFNADDSTHGYEPWRSDGTEAGTVMIKDINAADGSYPFQFTQLGSAIYFSADDGIYGRELWRTDGTDAGTVQVANIAPGSVSAEIVYLTAWDGTLFFGANDSTHGRELWTSDGTATGTAMVKNAHTEARDSDASGFLEFDGKLFFTADHGYYGRELWTTDGTSAGTTIFKDIYSGSSASSPGGLTAIRGSLLFSAEGSWSQGRELWKSDGSSAGTVLVKDIRPGSGDSSPAFIAAVPGGAVFRADDGTNGLELWFSDGTEAGTHLLKDINPGASSPGIVETESIGNVALFRANDGINGTEPWVSDGTETGTHLLMDIFEGSSSSNPGSFTVVNGVVFFVADDAEHGQELWITDGTTPGTALVKDINPGAADGSGPSITSLDGILYFRAEDEVHGYELWRSDGTEAGTYMVADLWAGPDGSGPGLIGTLGDVMVLEAKDAAHGRELWVSDGTSSGTTFLADTLPGPDWWYHYGLGSHDGFLYFSNFNPETGLEIWRTDGTTTGTALAADVRPGPASSYTHFNYSHVFGNRLLFAATDDTVGRELWGACIGVFYPDQDGDGHGDPAGQFFDCDLPAGASATGDDCQDFDDAIFSGASELCDLKDNDCDGRADEPGFAGATSASDASGSGCGIELSWAAAATPTCGGATTYSVYRSTDAAFLPSPANRIAEGLTSTSFTDTFALGPTTTYNYIVHAYSVESDAEDPNLTRVAATLGACTPTPAARPPFFTARATSSRVDLEWLNPEWPYSFTRVCWSDSGYVTDADSCPTYVHDAFGTEDEPDSAAPFAMSNGTEYYFTAFTEGSGVGAGIWSDPIMCAARPFASPTEIPWVFSTGASALAPTGVLPGESLFVVSNDRTLHRMIGGSSGGMWPSGWRPGLMNGPGSARPAPVVFTTTKIGGASEVIFISSQDGHVYAFDTDTGTELWRSPRLGDALFAAPSGILSDLGGDRDVILVGSRTPGGDSAFYGLDLFTGAVVWRFDNGGGSDGIGIISGQAQVDYASDRVCFTSRQRAGGSTDTVWCLHLIDPPDWVELLWARDVGEIDGSPILRDGVLYVGNNQGEVRALDPASGADLWAAPYTPAASDGPVKGFVWVDTTTTPTHLYFATTSQIHGLIDNGTTVSPLSWSPLSVANPSPIIVVDGVLWVGSGGATNASLKGIDVSDGTTIATTVLGDPTVAKTVGAPTFDIQTSMITVGTDEGRVYAVEVP